MALQPRAELPIARYQFGVGDGARCFERGIQQWGGVSFGQNEVVVVRMVRALPVVAQVAREQYGHQVGGRHARGGMPGPRGGAAADRVDSQLLSQLPDHRHVDALIGEFTQRKVSSGRMLVGYQAGRSRPR